jgi:hypothetical protein
MRRPAYREALISAVLKMGRWPDADGLVSLFLPSRPKTGAIFAQVHLVIIDGILVG